VSGSPIIQNGKLVGAVTHVLVNSPDTGYGIFIENKLEVHHTRKIGTNHRGVIGKNVSSIQKHNPK